MLKEDLEEHQLHIGKLRLIIQHTSNLVGVTGSLEGLVQEADFDLEAGLHLKDSISAYCKFCIGVL